MEDRPIFSDQFKAVYGRPIEFFLSGGHKSTIGREEIFHDTHEEHDEWIKQSFSPTMVEKLTDSRSRYEDEMATPVGVRESIIKFRSNPHAVATGDPLRTARQIMALDNELRTNSRPNPTPLYRGARRSPVTDATANRPLSFSENRHVAGHFAKSSRGEIFKVGKEEVRGLRMEDYGVKPMTIGPSQLSEAEWLVDPRSLP